MKTILVINVWNEIQRPSQLVLLQSAHGNFPWCGISIWELGTKSCCKCFRAAPCNPAAVLQILPLKLSLVPLVYNRDLQPDNAILLKTVKMYMLMIFFPLIPSPPTVYTSYNLLSFPDKMLFSQSFVPVGSEKISTTLERVLNSILFDSLTRALLIKF